MKSELSVFLQNFSVPLFFSHHVRFFVMHSVLVGIQASCTLENVILPYFILTEIEEDQLRERKTLRKTRQLKKQHTVSCACFVQSKVSKSGSLSIESSMGKWECSWLICQLLSALCEYN